MSWVKPLLLLVAVAAAALILRAAGFDAQASMAGAGRHGPWLFVGLGTMACALGAPRQAVAWAGGLAFGVWGGSALALAAELGGCAVDFLLARRLAREPARRFLERRAQGRLHRLDRMLSRRAFAATLTLRLLPVGNNLVLNLLAGVSGVAPAPFLAASLLGYVPQTVVFALAGSGTGVSDAWQVALAAALLLASIGLGLWLARRPDLPVQPSVDLA